MSFTAPPYPTGDRNILARLVNDETFRRFPPGGEYNPNTGAISDADNSKDFNSDSGGIDPDFNRQPGVHVRKYHVCIVGAGMAGLYTAMILKSLHIEYTMIEASGRIGGRVYTHRFSQDAGDYYDVGAMRFPESPEMERLFHLFSGLEMDKNETAVKEAGDLIPYYLAGPNTPVYINNRHQLPPTTADKDFHSWGDNKGGNVPVRYIAAGPAAVLKSVLEPWRQKYRVDPKGTWNKLLAKDRFSTTVRQAIMKRLKKDDDELTTRQCYSIAQWCETMGSSTSRFDGSFVECFLHSIDFDYPKDPGSGTVKSLNFWGMSFESTNANSSTNANTFDKTNKDWWCVNGGAGILADRMEASLLPRTITKLTPVTSIFRDKSSDLPMLVRLRNIAVDLPTTVLRCSHVITTTTAACLRIMDLTEAGLSTDQREALRTLHYDTAVKFGIQFSKKWWMGKGITKGGQGKTDRPTRMVVYPSYALEDGADKPGVLLACYNATTDALRIGALARGSDPTNQPLILEIVLRDLAVMHRMSYEELKPLATAHHFHDWSRDEFTGGGWGEFAPGQFAQFLTSMQIPAAGGNLFFAGDFTCISHGWIVAALNSAHRAVALMLLREKDEKKLTRLFEQWGQVDGHDKKSLQALLDRTLGGVIGQLSA